MSAFSRSISAACLPCSNIWCVWGEGRAFKKRSLDELVLVGKRTQDEAGPRRPKGQRLLTSVRTLIDKASVPGSRFVMKEPQLLKGERRGSLLNTTERSDASARLVGSREILLHKVDRLRWENIPALAICFSGNGSSSTALRNSRLKSLFAYPI